MDQSFSPRLLPDRPPTQAYSQLSLNAFHQKKSQTTFPYECINNSNNNSHLIMSNNNNNNALSPVPMSSIKMEREECFDSSSSDLMPCKRSKFSPTSFSLNGNPPVAARRNERERNRVKQVNMGFSTLRQRVPDGVKNKKMSKVETLRSAVEYIKKLQKMLNETSSAGAEGMMTTMCGSRESTETSCTPDSGVSYRHATSSGNDVDSSPISSTSPSSVMEASDMCYNENDRERCFTGSDDDIISFSKWFS